MFLFNLALAVRACVKSIDGVLVAPAKAGATNTPYMDIGNLLRHTHQDYHSKIKAGLEAGGMCLPMDWSERAELVDLTSHLEFLTSNRSASFKKQCAARVVNLMRNYGYGI